MSVATGTPDPNDPNWRRRRSLSKAIEEARRIMKETGQTDMAKVLLSMGLIVQREVCQARAQELGMAFADLDRIVVSPEARACLSPELSRELRVLPVKRDGNTLWLAMDEPDSDRIEKVKQATGLRVIPAMCLPAALDDALQSLP